MQRKPVLLFAFSALLFIAFVTLGKWAPTWAQTAPFHMDLWVAGGGGQSSSANYALSGVAGQSNIASPAAGANYYLDNGFSITGNSVIVRSFYMPIALKQESAPSMGWQRMGPGGYSINALAIQGDTLYAADRRGIGEGGGLYRRSLVGCNLSTDWTRVDAFNLSVLDIDFRGDLGVVAAFDSNGIFYSTNGGNSWTRTTALSPKPRAVAIVFDDVFFVGTEDDGVYKSTDGGLTWSRQSELPQAVNNIAFSPGTVWIGADGDIVQNAGVWKLRGINELPTRFIEGLPANDSRKVWDFLIDDSGSNIYIATDNGVFRGDGFSAWVDFDLSEVQLRSLAIFKNYLYAGEHDDNANAGIRRRLLTNGNWERIPSGNWSDTKDIRDLLAEASHCNGLLVGTQDGVWIYK